MCLLEIVKFMVPTIETPGIRSAPWLIAQNYAQELKVLTVDMGESTTFTKRDAKKQVEAQDPARTDESPRPKSKAKGRDKRDRAIVDADHDLDNARCKVYDKKGVLTGERNKLFLEDLVSLANVVVQQGANTAQQSDGRKCANIKRATISMGLEFAFQGSMNLKGKEYRAYSAFRMELLSSMVALAQEQQGTSTSSGGLERWLLEAVSESSEGKTSAKAGDSLEAVLGSDSSGFIGYLRDNPSDMPCKMHEALSASFKQLWSTSKAKSYFVWF